MATAGSADRFLVILPCTIAERRWNLPSNCEVRYLRRYAMREIGRLIDVYWHIPRLCRGADACLTLGDLGPISLPTPHVIFLHNPYLLSDDPALRAALPFWERLKLCYQRWHFGQSAARAHEIIVQTPIMVEAVRKRFPAISTPLGVVPPALPQHVNGFMVQRPTPRDYGTHSSCIKLLFLSAYYPHKNHRILPRVVEVLRARGMASQVQIYVTLANPEKVEGWSPDIGDVVRNLGPLTAAEVAPALLGASAMFIPTLAETYGLPYLEALALEVPVLTSDRGFARFICGDAAVYFDPLDPESIVDAISRLAAAPEDWRMKVRARRERAFIGCAVSQSENAASFLATVRTAVTKGKHS